MLITNGSAHVTWTQAILESYFGEDPVEETDLIQNPEFEEDLLEFDD